MADRALVAVAGAASLPTEVSVVAVAGSGGVAAGRVRAVTPPKAMPPASAMTALARMATVPVRPMLRCSARGGLWGVVPPDQTRGGLWGVVPPDQTRGGLW